jgi:hypothetical protein
MVRGWSKTSTSRKAWRGYQARLSRRISGISSDEGDGSNARLLPPVTERVAKCALSQVCPQIDKPGVLARQPHPRCHCEERQRRGNLVPNNCWRRQPTPALRASDRQAAMPADQLCPAQNRSPPHHPLLRMPSPPTLSASTIPFIPAYPLHLPSIPAAPHFATDRPAKTPTFIGINILTKFLHIS